MIALVPLLIANKNTPKKQTLATCINLKKKTCGLIDHSHQLSFPPQMYYLEVNPALMRFINIFRKINTMAPFNSNGRNLKMQE